MPKQKSTKETSKVNKVTEELPNTVAPAIVQEELDPEVLAALNAKKVKKTKNIRDVDYIPELERDENELE